MNRLNKVLAAIPVLIAITLVFYGYAGAGMEEDLAEIKRELQEIKKDIKDLKQILSVLKRPAKKPQQKTTATTTIDDDPMMGSPDAPVTLVEFSDYQCPFCARYYRSTQHVLIKEYVETNKLRYVFRDFPLSFHKQAQKAHEAANCSGEQGKYWEMHDRIFDDQTKMDVENLRQHASAMKLDMADFNTCLDSGKYADEIRKDIEAGSKAGVKGTPSFVLGITRKDGEVRGIFIRGAQPTEYFKKEIDKLLKQVSAKEGQK